MSMTNKKMVKFVLSIFVCAIVYVFASSTVEAKPVEYGKNYNVDLDGDGNKETVSYLTDGYEDYNITIKICINGNQLKSVKCDNANGAVVSVVDINKNDRKKEIYVHFYSDSDCFEKGVAYRYNGKSLVNCFSLSQKKASSPRLSIVENQPGDGKVYFECEYESDSFMQGYVTQKYKIKSKKLEPTSTKVLAKTAQSKKSVYRPIRDMKVYKDSSLKTESFILKKYEKFYIEKISFKNPKNLWANKNEKSIYIRTKSGKKGWIKVPSDRFCEGYNKYSGWSIWAYTWG